MSGAQALTRSPAGKGVEGVFALLGVQIIEAFDSLYLQPGIRLILARYEQSLIYMVDGCARTTGKPGVGLVLPSPRALNATAGLGMVHATSSPVLLVCGQIESYNQGEDQVALREIPEQLEVFCQLTKWCARTNNVKEIPGWCTPPWNKYRETPSGGDRGAVECSADHRRRRFAGAGGFPQAAL